ncbi:MAG: hypothetical protein RLZZ200_1653 [Pseudomonadota bacterium]|jgi:DNA-binding transcriptional regulator YiaG
MTPAELVTIRTRLRLSKIALATLLDRTPRTIYAWEHGEGPIPEKIARRVRALEQGVPK